MAKHYKEAIDASTQRHDAGIAGNLSVEYGFSLARLENTAVRAMEADAEEAGVEESLEDDTLASDLGEGAIAKLRSGTQSLIVARYQSARVVSGSPIYTDIARPAQREPAFEPASNWLGQHFCVERNSSSVRVALKEAAEKPAR